MEDLVGELFGENVKQAESRWRRMGVKDMTCELYVRTFKKQGSGCGVCGWKPRQGGRLLAVDHDHRTGRFRGLLCGKCNSKLGHFERYLLGKPRPSPGVNMSW